MILFLKTGEEESWIVLAVILFCRERFCGVHCG